ncbi:hypothetical protein [Mucilaginibacter polytrichastri]|uniref:Lipocalin-like domain-containing protein n=1 Tax=Mucilaginibacter polytrichastri TaxID=1302689 RepID=A0A1Q5ZXY6_9SPHI|nr:hypothetical protein [Mucilaginibacter polytrichastri]OKS86623.1 hypothetical protein RG47T_2079 [Mucilaginibacter polytrichastri]SFS81097.1 hypothetical protein SAMN04487890_104190 [Mucilaginibacter polytrichastri]
MRVHKLLALTAAVVLLGSCKKSELKSLKLNGTYSGQFSTRNNPLTNSIVESLHSVTVKFSGSNYQSTANPDYMPAGGQGSFLTKNDEITFRDTTVHTANFDANLVLNGTYNYSTKGDSLLIVKQINYVFYTYKLKRQ